MFQNRNSRPSLVLIVLALSIFSVVHAEIPEAPLADPSGFSKCRFISFRVPVPAGPPTETALRVWLVSLHHVDPPYSGGPATPFTLFEGRSVWVGPPASYVESSSSQVPFRVSTTQCTPHYRDWSTVGLFHVTGAHIAPSSIFEVEQVSSQCQGIEETCAAVSSPLEIRTTRWGDVEFPFNPPTVAMQGDLSDVSASVDKFRDILGAPIKVRILSVASDAFGNINSSTLSGDIGFGPISSIVNAFKGRGYPCKMGKCATPASYCQGNPSIPCVFSSQCTNAGTTGPCLSLPPNCTTNADCGAGAPCNLYCP